MPLWGYYYHWLYLRASWYFCYVLDVVGAVVVAAAVDTTKIHVPVLLEVSIFSVFHVLHVCRLHYTKEQYKNTDRYSRLFCLTWVSKFGLHNIESRSHFL